jgi:hypothetical protein
MIPGVTAKQDIAKMMNRFIPMVALIGCVIGNLYGGQRQGDGKNPAIQDNQFKITVDVGLDSEYLPNIWQPGIATEGIGSPNSPSGYASDRTLEMWGDSPGFGEGFHQVQLRHHTFDQPGATLMERGEHIASILAQGGEVAIRLIGTPEGLLDPGEHPGNYWAYPPESMEEWENLIYDELKYLVVDGVVVNNPILFDDERDHQSLGLGDDIWFSCWYSIWGPDEFQFQGTEEEFFELWHHTCLAAKRLETDFDVDIRLGGFGFAQNVEEMWDYGGFIDRLIEFSSDPNEDGSDDDRIPIDWIDHQFRHTDPFPLSQPANWRVDYRNQIQTFLSMSGYDPGILVMANAWHGQTRVMGLSDSYGRSYVRGIEAQCEIDAALNPARLFDMNLAGQQKQYREAIQDFSDGNDFPLFPYSGIGSIGIATLGQKSEDFLGLKKAPWNTFQMIEMLGDIRLVVDSSGETLLGDQCTVNAIATRSIERNSVEILLWTYFSPFRYVENSPPTDQVDYSELYETIAEEIGSDSIYVSLFVDDMGYSDMRISRYLVDRYHGNAFTYRNEICWAIGLEGCVEQFPHERNYTIEEVNGWTFDNNPYGISVALERVEDFTINESEDYEVRLGLLPYATTLIVIRPNDGTDVEDEDNDESTSSSPLPTPVSSRQNAPNPFNPSTTIAFTVNEIEGISGSDSSKPGTRPVRLTVYDVRGRMIRELVNEDLPVGHYTTTWDGRDSLDRSVASGVYLYGISTVGYREFKKMILLK